MTDNNHPITPPRELVAKWITKGRSQDYCSTNEYVADQAARWGYEQRGAVNKAELQKARDEELEGCCEYIAGPGKWFPNEAFQSFRLDELRAARRPKPKSQAEQALALLDDSSDQLDAVHENAIRRALERLQELEALND